MSEIGTALRNGSRTIKPLVLAYFDEEPVVLGDEILSLDLLEEVASQGDSPFGYVSANEVSFRISNANRRFTATNTSSDLYGKLLPGVKLRVFLGALLGSGVLYIPIGTFYTGEWSMSNSEAFVTAYDRLFYKLGDEIPNVPVLTDTNIGEVFSYLFASMGIENYSVDSRLNEPIKVAWFKRERLSNALNDLCIAGNCFVYVDREDVVQVKPIMVDGEVVADLSEDDCYVVANPQKVLNTYGKVRVGYRSMYPTKEAKELLTLENLVAKEGVNPFRDLDISETPPIVEITEVSHTGEFEVQNISFGSYGISFDLIGEGTGDLKVKGRCLSGSTQSVEAGEGREMTIFNNYIQTERLAGTRAKELLPFVSDAFGEVNIDYRGDFSIKLYDIIQATDDINKVGTVKAMVVRHQLNYNGGLRGYITGRKVYSKAFKPVSISAGANIVVIGGAS